MFSNALRYLRNSAGTAAITFSLGAVVLLGAAGLALDSVIALEAKTKLHAAADSAALAAVAFAVEKSDSMDSSSVKSKAEAEGLELWNTSLASDFKGITVTPDVKVAYENGAWKSIVKYTANLPTTLTAVLGLSTYEVSGEVVANGGAALTDHWQFSLAIDTSSSMGIGATQTDMDNMAADPNIGCMFACHFADTNDSLYFARQGGHKLRLDVVDEAVDATIEELESAKGVKSEAQLLGFHTGVDELVTMTDDLGRIRDHHVQIARIPVSEGNTNYRSVLQDLTAKIGKSGSGSSRSSPRKAVFIVTDGIHDSTVWEDNVVLKQGDIHQMGTIDSKYCQALKDEGVLVGVLYIDYITPVGFEGYVEDYRSSILPSLQACASENMFQNANDAAGMKLALAKLLSSALQSSVRLTQ